MATWSLTVIIGGVDYSAHLVGRVEWTGAANAARTGTLHLSLAAGVIDMDAFRGVAVTVSAAWNGATYRRFTGWVARPAWDAKEQILSLSLTDRAQNYFRTLYLAGGRPAVQEVLTGARWSDAVHASGVSAGDGWDVASRLFETAPYSFSLSHSGAVRWLPWAGGALVATLSAAAGTTLGDAPPTLALVDLESLVNRVAATYESVDYRLHEWIMHAYWSSPDTDLCGDYYHHPWWLPTRDVIRSAAGGAGDWSIVHDAGGLGAGGGGIAFTGLPASGTYDCGQGPIVWSLKDAKIEGEALVVAADWEVSRRWSQRARRKYSMLIEAPDSVIAYGALVTTDEASADAGADASQGWDQSKTGRRPAGAWDSSGSAHAWLDTGSAAAARDDALCLAAIQATRILADHRRNRVDCPALPGDLVAAAGGGTVAVATLDIGDRVRIVGDLTATGVVEQIAEYWDLATGDAQTTLSLAVSQCPGAGGTASDLTAEELVPDMATVLDGTIDLVTHIGGRSDSPVYDAAWTGWITDLEVAQTNDPTKIYGKKDFKVSCPDVPAALRESDAVAASALLYYVYPPHDELAVTRG